jgi:hypothetical protein
MEIKKNEKTAINKNKLRPNLTFKPPYLIYVMKEKQNKEIQNICLNILPTLCELKVPSKSLVSMACLSSIVGEKASHKPITIIKRGIYVIKFFKLEALYEIIII